MGVPFHFICSILMVDTFLRRKKNGFLFCNIQSGGELLPIIPGYRKEMDVLLGNGRRKRRGAVMAGNLNHEVLDALKKELGCALPGAPDCSPAKVLRERERARQTFLAASKTGDLRLVLERGYNEFKFLSDLCSNPHPLSVSLCVCFFCIREEER